MVVTCRRARSDMILTSLPWISDWYSAVARRRRSNSGAAVEADEEVGDGRWRRIDSRRYGIRVMIMERAWEAMAK